MRSLIPALLIGGLAWSAPEPKLADAVMREEKTEVRALLDKKADPNIPLADGSTALHWAAQTEDVEIVDWLLKAGASVKAKDRYGFTPLYFAAANGNAAIASKLLDAGADPNAADENQETALITAARSGNADVLKALLQHGASVNAKDSVTGQTALMWAVRANDSKAVALLVEYGAAVNARTREGAAPAFRPPGAGGGSHGVGIVRGGWPERGYRDAQPGGMTPLLYAARDGRRDIAASLLQSKASIDLADANGITPLITAITNNHLGLAQFLVENGANVNAVDWWGRTPLWAAIEMRDRDYGRAEEHDIDRPAALELMRALIDRGANPNARTKEAIPVRRFVEPLGDLSWVDFTGQTPFLRAALSADLPAMRLLLAKGADPNIAAYAGTTPLMAAAGVNWMAAQTFTESKEAQLEAVKLCLEKGGDVNAVNSMGITAVMGAANRGSDEIIQFLVSKGARLDVKDKEGRTASTWAEGVFLATNAPEAKPSSMALIKRLMK